MQRWLLATQNIRCEVKGSPSNCARNRRFFKRSRKPVVVAAASLRAACMVRCAPIFAAAAASMGSMPAPFSEIAGRLAIPPQWWQKGRFSIALPPPESPEDVYRTATNAFKNGLGPLLSGTATGVAFVHATTPFVSLEVGGAAGSGGNPSSSTSVSFPIDAGGIVLGPGQEIRVILRPAKEALATDDDTRRGSVRCDFAVTWCGQEDNGADGGSSGSDEDAGAAAAVSGYGSGGGGGGGLAMGHVVNEPRPLDPERQKALDEALLGLGIDPRILSDGDEFMGTSAMKTYNTFTRPKRRKESKKRRGSGRGGGSGTGGGGNGGEDSAHSGVQRSETVEAAAGRTAHQVAFFIRRVRADRDEELRNKDRALSESARAALTPFPLRLVLDNVRSAYNVGSCFRTADTARAAEVITCGFSPHPFGPGGEKIRKTAFGSADSVATRHFNDPCAAVAALRAEGHVIYALETTATAMSLFDVRFDPARPVAFVLGNEITGVDCTVVAACDGVLEVPVFGLKNSLNVASVAAIVIYEALRQWHGGGGERETGDAAVAASPPSI
ncbi:unnamed protein product [Phaeothamnion confervicola]